MLQDSIIMFVQHNNVLYYVYIIFNVLLYFVCLHYILMSLYTLCLIIMYNMYTYNCYDQHVASYPTLYLILPLYSI